MPRKNEAIWIEKQNRWMIKVQMDGIRKAFYSSAKGTKGKIEAERKADKWLNVGGDPANVRFDEAWKEYLEEVNILTSFSNYRQAEQIGRLWLLPSLKHHYVRNITDQDWQKCINTAYKKGKYKKTLKNIRGRIANFCKYAQKARYIDRQPFDLRIPKDAAVRERPILQPDAVKVLFEKDIELWNGSPRPAFFIHAFRFAVVTGLRRGELCGLKKTDLTDDILSIKRAINEYYEETPGKNANAQRSIVQCDIAKSILDDQHNMLKELGIISPYIFPEETGIALRPRHFYDAWVRYRNTHGFNCDIQGLRRTMISMIKNDVPLDMMQRVVGHSEDMDTLGVYGREVDGEMVKAALLINDVFQRMLYEEKE